jgi:hypothetical protein
MNTCKASNLQPLIMASTAWASRAFVRQDNDKLQHGGRTSIVHYMSYQFLFCSKSDIAQETFHTVFDLVRITGTKTHRNLWERWLKDRPTVIWHKKSCCPISPFRRTILPPSSRLRICQERNKLLPSCSLLIASTFHHPASHIFWTVGSFRGAKAAGGWSYHWLTYNAEFMNGGAIPPVHHTSIWRSSLRWISNMWLWFFHDFERWLIPMQITNPSFRQRGSPQEQSYCPTKEEELENLAMGPQGVPNTQTDMSTDRRSKNQLHTSRILLLERPSVRTVGVVQDAVAVSALGVKSRCGCGKGTVTQEGEHQPLEAGTKGLLWDSRPTGRSLCYNELQTDCV